MKPVYCVLSVAFLLTLTPTANLMRIFFPPLPSFVSKSTATATTPTTTTTTTKATTTTKPTTTTTWRTTTTTPYRTTTGRGLDLRGKMVTLSRNSGVTFYSPYYNPDSSTTTGYPSTQWSTPRPTFTSTTPTAKATTTTTRPTTTTTTRATTTTTTRPTTTTTTRPTTTTTRCTKTATTTNPTTTTTWTTSWPSTTPSTRGVSVCLRFMVDYTSILLFTLSPYTSQTLSLSFENTQWYSLRWNGFYSNSVPLSPVIPVWPSVRTQPWTSVCVVVDTYKNVAQVFQGGSMSIRKILPSSFSWSKQPTLEMSNFDGQVTDLEVWDYPLTNYQILSFMMNYGSSGALLSWSNIVYRNDGMILVEEKYDLGQSQPISVSEGENQPIRSGQGRYIRLTYKKTLRRRTQTERKTI